MAKRVWTYGSLFSGVGGGDRGMDAAGFRCAWQIEIDGQCRGVLARHWPGVARYADVRHCHGTDDFLGQARRIKHLDAPRMLPTAEALRLARSHALPRVDVIVGGFPCQSVSAAGRRRGFADTAKSGLWHEYARIVRELRPLVVLVENVMGLLNGGDHGEEPNDTCLCGWTRGWGRMHVPSWDDENENLLHHGQCEFDGKGKGDTSGTVPQVRGQFPRIPRGDGQVGESPRLEDSWQGSDGLVAGNIAASKTEVGTSQDHFGIPRDDRSTAPPTERLRGMDGRSEGTRDSDARAGQGVEPEGTGSDSGWVVGSGTTDARDDATCPSCGRGMGGAATRNVFRSWMGTVVRDMAEHGYSGGWTCLDGQHFGVPQRRRRVFGVFTRGSLGSQCAFDVLAVPDRLRGHSQAGRQAGARTAGPVAGCLGGGGGPDDNDARGNRRVGSLGAAGAGRGHRLGAEEAAAGQVVVHDPESVLTPTAFGGGNRGELGVTTALTGQGGRRGDFDSETFVVGQCHGGSVGELGTLRGNDKGVSGGVPFVVHATESGAKERHAYQAETARCLDQTGGFAPAQGGTLVLDVYSQKADDTVPALWAGQKGHSGSPHAVLAFGSKDSGQDDADLAPTLRAGTHADSHANGGVPPAVAVTPILESGKRVNDHPRAGVGVGEAGSPMYTIGADSRHAVAFSWQDGENADRDAKKGGSPPLRANQTVAVVAGTVGASGAGTARTGNGNEAVPPATVVNLAPVALCEGGHGLTETDVSQSLQGAGGKPGQGYQAVRTMGVVRRLVPVETERLMSWPDGWTEFLANGTRLADGPRYRMCGNGIVSNCVEWLAKRLLPWMPRLARAAKKGTPS